MTDIFNTPPSFEEFVAHIRTLKNNSGPGPSGCSYNMIKSWPEVTKKAAYDCLAQFWTDKHIPTHWKWRWLVPAPKKPTDTPLMADLRPLMLTEATRKAWISLILSKIRSVTKSLNMFNSAQHGYVPGRGTMSASILFINILESAKMDCGVSNRTSYDMSKAFDTVSKNIQKIAWSRMGVPADVVDWLVDMDTDGVTVVRSPYALEKWDTHDYRSIITT
jgi:hypothetical protein